MRFSTIPLQVLKTGRVAIANHGLIRMVILFRFFPEVQVPYFQQKKLFEWIFKLSGKDPFTWPFGFFQIPMAVVTETLAIIYLFLTTD